MKKFLLSIVLLLLAISSSYSQINFVFSDFKITTGDTIKYISYAVESSSISKPIEGANKTWDYRNSSTIFNNLYTLYNANPKKGEFENAEFMINSFYTLGSIPTSIVTREYFNINTNGYEQLGLYHDSTFLKLDDNGVNYLAIPYQKADFTPSIRQVYKYPFDITFAQNNFPTVRRSTNFFLNYYPIYTKAPASFMRSVTRTVKTVGWGNLKLPNQKNTLPSVLVKTVEVTIDSVFINSLPAPEPLLQQFAIIQGGSNTFTKYEFWSKGNNIPVYSMEYINNNASVNITMKSNLTNTNTDVEETAQIETSISPNPSINNSINLLMNKENQNRWYLVIYDESGKIVKSENIDESGIISKYISLVNISTSKLFYSILDENYKMVSSGSIIH